MRISDWSSDVCSSDLFELCIAAVATVYAIGMILAGGLGFFVLSSLIYAPGTILFIIARREQRGAIFAAFDWPILGIVVLGALAGLWGLAHRTMRLYPVRKRRASGKGVSGRASL